MTDRLRTAAVACCASGLAIAGYLTYVHYAGISPVGEIAHVCEKVQTSHWSRIAGVPVARVGLLASDGILTALFVPGALGLMEAPGQAVTGAGFSASLSYREVFT